MYSQPRLLQGVFPFQGRGLAHASLLSPELCYSVPAGKQAQLVYFRAGNSCDELIDVICMRDGRPMRYFPLGARGHCHIALAIVEDLAAGSRLEVHLAAPEGAAGTVVLDVGLVEMDAF